MSTLPALQIAVQQIEFARQYTKTLLEDVSDAEWFQMPAGSATHVAWQVGHLAMAQYGLCLFRVRGRRPEDLELMTSEFRKQFSKGTTPQPDAGNLPAPDEIRRVLDRVHQQALQELATYTPAQLDEPVDPPHAVFPTKLGAIFFCSAHEMLHAGQIGLLRRLLGKKPIR